MTSLDTVPIHMFVQATILQILLPTDSLATAPTGRCTQGESITLGHGLLARLMS